MALTSEFVGVKALKARQAEQVAKFEKIVEAGKFSSIHNDHFDWWMFPIDEKSSRGLQYTVNTSAPAVLMDGRRLLTLLRHSGTIDELKADEEFTKSYLRGVELLFLAYGWRLAERKAVSSPAAGQAWPSYPVRLFKCLKSLRLFGQEQALASAKRYVESIGFGPGMAIDPKFDDCKRIFRILQLPGYESIQEPPPRYK